MADIRPSGVDKHSVEGELDVRLCNYTDVYKNDRITDDMPLMAATASMDEVRRFSLLPGDVIITKDSETPDDIAVPAVVTEALTNVVCGYHLTLLRPFPGTVGRYLFWCLKAAEVNSQMSLAAQGVTRFGITSKATARVAIPCPGRETQLAIADFLDRETAKLDALAAEQGALLMLLKEKRVADASYFITKGLDSSAELKESGLPWVGRIPKHWSVVPLMRLVDESRPIMYGIVLPGEDVGVGIPIVKGGNVKPSRLNLASLARTTPEIEASYARARLRAGDLVYSIRGTIGDCELVPSELEGANITQDVARVAPRNGINSSWLRHALLSKPVREALACGSLGAAVRGINIFDLKRVSIPVPPPEERDAIARLLDADAQTIEVLSAEARASIGLLRERRAALISAAVTGRIDVCAAASRNLEVAA